MVEVDRESPAESQDDVGRRPEAITWREILVVCAGYVLLTVLMTWPIALHLGTRHVRNPDMYVSAWTLAWVEHQVVRDPIHLFDANMYYPVRRSLAFGESHLPQALLAAPVLAVGGSPLLAYNVVFLLSFILCGVSAYALGRELGASRPAAFLAGVGYSFCAYRFDHIVHLQTLSAQWLPLAVLFLLRAARTGKIRDLLGFVSFSLLQMFSSGYYALLMGPLLGAVFLAVWSQTSRARRMRILAAFISIGILAFVLTEPYRAVQREYHFERTREECVYWSARWRSYLSPGPYVALPHHVVLRRAFYDAEPLYPGVVFLALGFAGLALVRSRGGRVAVVIAGVGLLLSLGPDVHLGPLTIPGPYDLLRHLPGGAMARTPCRNAVAALLGLDLLAALAWTRLSRGRRWGSAAGVVLVSLAVVDALPVRLHESIRPIPGAPASAHWLAAAPRGAVLELPWVRWSDAALYAYWSTVHWQPMVNGYASFEPQVEPTHYALGLLGQRWPNAQLAHLLRQRGVRYVVVHTERLRPAARARVLATPAPPGVHLVAQLDSDLVYEIEPTAAKAGAPATAEPRASGS